MAVLGEAGAADSRASAPPPAPIVVEGVGFAFPESALHDEKADVYLVSNFGGFISRLAPDGSVLDLQWITENLTAPTGMTIVDDVLYVVDRTAVKIFDRASGAFLTAISLPAGVSFLNDVCAGPRNTLYVTDSGFVLDENLNVVPTGTDAIYRIRDGEVSTFAEGTWLNNPNGCTTLGANVLVAAFNDNGEVYRINPSGKEKVIASLPERGLNDGVLRVQGSLFVASWETNAVYRMSLAGKELTKVLDLGTPADLGYDAKRNRLLVPSLFGNVLVIQPL